MDRDLADLVQDAIAVALSSLHRLQDPGALEPWLASVAANTARKALRARTRRRWLNAFLDPNDENRYEPASAALDLEARRALRSVYTILSTLPANERLVFASRHIEGMDLGAIASTCGVSLATIKRRLTRAERLFHAKARRHPELSQWLESHLRRSKKR